MRGQWSIVLLLVTVAGCRSVAQFSSADALNAPAALPMKYEVRSGQLEFHSNFELSADHRLVRQLTAERDDICQTLGLPCASETISVFLFHDAESFREYLSYHYPSVPTRRAFFLETDAQLKVYAHWSDHMAEDLRHEVAHGYLHIIVPGLPLWLDEGLAEYFEVPRQQVGLHRPHLDLLADLIEHNGWQPDLHRLEQLKDVAEMDQASYAEAWAWVYFLLHSGPEQRELLTNYLQELNEHGSTEPLSARLTRKHVQPEQTLVAYLEDLKQ